MKKRALFLGAVSLMSAFNVACSSPSPADLAAEAAVASAHKTAVSAIVEISAARCTPQNADQGYHTRLTAVLEQQSTETLTTLRQHNVGVCLDARLAGQKKFEVVYYGTARLAAVTDNGKPYVQGEWRQENGAFGVGSELRKLASGLAQNTIDHSQNYYAYSYRTASKHKRTITVLQTEKDLGSAAEEDFAQNPWLRETPAVAQKKAENVVRQAVRNHENPTTNL